MNVLVVGAGSFIAKKLILSNEKSKKYNLLLAGRDRSFDIYLDVTSVESINSINLSGYQLDAILFFQGQNPKLNLEESSMQHFVDMYTLNIAGPSQIIKKCIPHLNKNASILFMNSIASQKGSYDPAYAACKSALIGFIPSLSKAYKDYRFNSIVLGLIEGSTVYNQMTPDYREKHASNMFGNNLIKIENVISIIDETLKNTNLSNSCIPLHGGYTI